MPDLSGAETGHIRSKELGQQIRWDIDLNSVPDASESVIAFRADGVF